MRKALSLITIFILATQIALCEHFVIMHTNDTHSMIDPDHDGKGGILRRKVLIDSIRNAEPNSLLIDAGDVVQGTPYFSIFGGELEYALLDSLGYEMIILGNHEFDNGMYDIAKYYKNIKAEKLTSNYTVDGTPLEGLFAPYTFRKFGDKKIAFIGINLDPEGMIAAINSKGVIYNDPYIIADSLAHDLKTKEGADAVIAITHIGYPSNSKHVNDVDLIKTSHYIDLVIGGHSHTTIDPKNPKSPTSAVANADNKLITVCQTGSSGKYLGLIDIDFDNEFHAESRLIPVDARLDNKMSKSLESFISPYKHVVDSLMNNPIIVSEIELPNTRAPQTLNWLADLAYSMGNRLNCGDIDLAIMNKGGMRRGLPKGEVSEGLLGAMFPFDNKLVALRITGKDLKDALSVMASRGGDAVSAGVKVIYDKNNKIKKATLNGHAIKDNETYTLLTLDYLADGGDYMVPLKKGVRIAKDKTTFGTAVIETLRERGKQSKRLTATSEIRMLKQ